MANTFRKIYKKTGSTGTSADYELTGVVGVNGVELGIMKGASDSSDGEIGLVPKPTSGQEDYLLSGDGVWIPPDTIIDNAEHIHIIDNRNILGSNCELYFHRLGNICLFYFRGVFSATAGTVSILISNDDIPKEFRPDGNRFFTLSVVTNINVVGNARMEINKLGELKLLTSYTGNAEYYLDACYLIESKY